MARKTLIQTCFVEPVRASHNCRANKKKHRLVPGQQRFCVKVGRSTWKYCVPCGIQIVESDILKLQELLASLKAARALESPRREEPLHSLAG